MLSCRLCLVAGLLVGAFGLLRAASVPVVPFFHLHNCCLAQLLQRMARDSGELGERIEFIEPENLWDAGWFGPAQPRACKASAEPSKNKFDATNKHARSNVVPSVVAAVLGLILRVSAVGVRVTRGCGGCTGVQCACGCSQSVRCKVGFCRGACGTGTRYRVQQCMTTWHRRTRL